MFSVEGSYTVQRRLLNVSSLLLYIIIINDDRVISSDQDRRSPVSVSVHLDMDTYMCIRVYVQAYRSGRRNS